jgi:hypothetical protein
MASFVGGFYCVLIVSLVQATVTGLRVRCSRLRVLKYGLFVIAKAIEARADTQV